MLAQIVGVFDAPSMVVCVVFFGAQAACIIALIYRKHAPDYALDNKKLDNDHKEKLHNIDLQLQIQRNADNKLIASHHRVNEA